MIKGLFSKLKDRLGATHKSLVEKTTALVLRRGKVDDETLDDLEEILIEADVGVSTTMELVKRLRDASRMERNKTLTAEWLSEHLKNDIRNLIGNNNRELSVTDSPPTIYLIVGVNGVGKTTAIGKLANKFKKEGRSVMLIAADTFRAAAIQQLEIWAERAGVEITKGQEGADPGSVVFDGINAAVARKINTVIIDTAGRLHTKVNLMKELGKITKIIGRHIPEAPHETLLVLDASTGQNGLAQAKIFTESTGVTGIILTKLDGTAKGGVTVSIHHDLKIPVKMIGIGEGIEDLEIFDPETFVEAFVCVKAFGQ